MRYIWHILRDTFGTYDGIYLAKTIGYFMGYILQNYGIYWAKIMGYIG